MFFFPETKGAPSEEMDKIFGGNQGQADMQPYYGNSKQTGDLSAEEMDLAKAKEADVDYATVEEQERIADEARVASEVQRYRSSHQVPR
jgi:hypothetical protein